MSVIAILCFTVGVSMTINLGVLIIKQIKKRRLPYVLIKADKTNITPWTQRSSKLDVDLTGYRVDFQYNYGGVTYKQYMNFEWEDDFKGEFLELYINRDKPGDILPVSHYKALIGVSNIIALVIFNLLFIIPCFYFGFNLI